MTAEHDSNLSDKKITQKPTRTGLGALAQTMAGYFTGRAEFYRSKGMAFEADLMDGAATDLLHEGTLADVLMEEAFGSGEPPTE